MAADQVTLGSRGALWISVPMSFRTSLPPIVTRLSLLWGSNNASQLEIEIKHGGNLLPQGRTIDMPWLSINRFQVQFSELMVLTARISGLEKRTGSHVWAGEGQWFR